MSSEGGSERTQRTVAELLAKYGGTSGEGAPRRRRRRADDVSDTAPQAIIERVKSDTGTSMQPIREDEPPHERVSHRQTRGGQPPAPKPQRGRPGPPPPPERQAPPPPPLRDEPMTEQLPRVRERAEPDPRPAARPPEPPTAMVAPPVRRGPDPVDEDTHLDTPPVEPPTAITKAPPRRQPLLPRRQPNQARPAPGRGPQPSQPLPLPPGEVGEGSAPRAFPPARQAPDFPGDSSETAVDDRPPPQEFLEDYEGYDHRAASRFDDYQAHDDLAVHPGDEPDLDDRRESTAYTDPAELFGDDDDEDEYDVQGGPRRYDEYPRDGYQGGDYPSGEQDAVDLDDRPIGDGVDDDDAAPAERNPTKEWLVMGGQLAVSVVGGGAVWLLFNWLWGVLPAAALVAALVVIAGMVLIVRKIRKAEDLQTTVFAILVGLVVTVSPAVLLLLRR